MATIWPAYDGRNPTPEEPWAEIPFSEAIGLLELKPTDFLADLRTTPRFGNTGEDLTWTGFKRIVVEVPPDEVVQPWKPGFYVSKVKPKEALRRLLEFAVKPAFGADNVVRVDYKQTADTLGQDALGITVVLKPRAIKRLARGSVLDALVGLQNRLREMGVSGTPIVEYTTEEELAQNAGS